MKKFLWSFIILSMTVTSCKKESTENILDQQIYFNSFESNSDTNGWNGYAYSFTNDAPSQGGKRSLAISGGCIIPHAQCTISAQNTDCYLVLKFYGKNLSNGGSVSLNVNKPGYGSINYGVSEKDWTIYENHDTLFCPANTSLTLSVIAGGIIYSAILIDMIEIKKVTISK
jgi:hypothetical protein